MGIKISSDKQLRFYKDNDYLIIHRYRCFMHPNHVKPVSYFVIFDDDYNSLGKCRITFLEYGRSKQEGFNNQLYGYLAFSGFDGIGEWIDYIEDSTNKSINAEYGAFYRIEKYRFVV